jgi:hypothetical protein
MASPAPSPGRDNVVGIALIVGAVLVGLLLLVKGYDNEGGVVAESTAASTTTTVPVEATTTTTLPSKAPAEVPVKVANASGNPANGLAGTTRTALEGKGYTQVSVTDAPSPVTSTQVLFVEGSQGDAQAVAAALGLPVDVVQPMTSPPPVTLGDATVLVLAGPDLL